MIFVNFAFRNPAPSVMPRWLPSHGAADGRGRRPGFYILICNIQNNGSKENIEFLDRTHGKQ